MSSTIRFNEATWYSLISRSSANVVGLGNIGSYLAYYLSKSFNHIILIDYDKIEEHNVSGQLYLNDQIGEYKADSIKELIQAMGSECHITLKKCSFSNIDKKSKSMMKDIIFSCVDNMSARREIFMDFLSNKELNYFIDGRAEAENYHIFILSKKEPLFDRQIEYYDSSLFEDASIPDVPCNFKSTPHCGASIAANMMALATNLCYNEKMGTSIMPVPLKMTIHMTFCIQQLYYMENYLEDSKKVELIDVVC